MYTPARSRLEHIHELAMCLLQEDHVQLRLKCWSPKVRFRSVDEQLLIILEHPSDLSNLALAERDGFGLSRQECLPCAGVDLQEAGW